MQVPSRLHHAVPFLYLAFLFLPGCAARSVEPTPTLVAMPTPSVMPDPAVIHQASPTAVPELSSPTATVEEGELAMPFAMSSRAFKHGETIPVRYSCDGEDVSPELLWTDPPTGTRSFALIMDDPDAPRGTWVHWVLFNIPAAARGLPEGVSDADEQPDGGRHGENSWGRSGYGGPCPPSGTHRYFFKLYALDQTLNLAALASTADLEAAMQGHILAQADLMGTYPR